MFKQHSAASHYTSNVQAEELWVLSESDMMSCISCIWVSDSSVEVLCAFAIKVAVCQNDIECCNLKAPNH
jgi:hypothetical protein